MPVNLLCSRNARPKKALVGRAKWEIKQDTLHWREDEQAWSAIYSSENYSLDGCTRKLLTHLHGWVVALHVVS